MTFSLMFSPPIQATTPEIALVSPPAGKTCLIGLNLKMPRSTVSQRIKNNSKQVNLDPGGVLSWWLQKARVCTGVPWHHSLFQAPSGGSPPSSVKATVNGTTDLPASLLCLHLHGGFSGGRQREKLGWHEGLHFPHLKPAKGEREWN